MKDETIQEISTKLDSLKSSLIQNGVSMVTDEDGNLIFFDTAMFNYHFGPTTRLKMILRQRTSISTYIC